MTPSRVMQGVRNGGAAVVVAAALVATTLAPTPAAARAGGSGAVVRGSWAMASPAEGGEGEEAPAAVVGLDAQGAEQGVALTGALRRAFAARGLSGGKEVNLSELRLALGCKGTSPECLVRGGELLEARRLVYGTLRRAKGGGWSLELTLLEVEGGAETSVTMALAPAELAPERIDRTAEEIADRLAPDVEVSDAPGRGAEGLATPPPEPVERPEDEPRAEGGKGKLYLGWERPQPRWKLAGFGASAGVLVVTTGAAIGMSVYLTGRNVGFRKRLLDAANASLTDDNANNDIDPGSPETVNLCDLARARPTDASGNPLGMPGQVRNAAVAKVCNDADLIRSAQIGTAVVAGVSLASTVVFTLLLLVHRKPAREGAWRRHGLAVGADASGGRGLGLRASGRF